MKYDRRFMGKIGVAAGLVLALVAGCMNPSVNAPREPSKLTLATLGKTAYVITLARDHSAAEGYAAEELARYLKEMTGAEFAMVTPEERGKRPAIAVGPGAAHSIAPDLKLEELGPEGIVLRTAGRHLILTGGPGAPRGTLYAAYHFLDNILGVRWWAKGATFVPQKPELKIEALALEQRPAFEMRGNLGYDPAWDQEWLARNRLNRVYYYAWNVPAPSESTVARFTLDEKHGGGINFPMIDGIQNGGHSFNIYLPRDKYFDAHPDWFAEINGKRTKDGQPCLTNLEVLKVVTEAVLEDLRKDPKAAMVHVSQWDNDGPCRCANCRKIDEEEGSPAGTLLRFVNAVAEQVEKIRPDVLVETYSYTYTLPAPKLTRPRANVTIRFCGTYHTTFFRPIDAPENAGLLQNLQAWKAIAPHLYVYDYMLNRVRPYPSLRSLGPNLRLMAQNNVKGYCVDSISGMTEFAELRSWVITRMLWNPALDDQALIAEFCNGYYGAAGRYVLDYINLVHDAAAKGNCILYAGGEMEPSPFVTYEVMSKAEALFCDAEAAVAKEPAILNRVRRAHMSVQYVWAINRDVWAEEAKEKGLPNPRPAGEFYEALCRQAAIEIERARTEPLDFSAAAAAGTLQHLHALIEQKGVGTQEKNRWETFLTTAKKEMDQGPLKASIKAKASSSYGGQPYQAFDGDPASTWGPGGTGGWIQRDMGKTVKVKAIQTLFGFWLIQMDYQIEGSLDEKNWFILVPRKSIPISKGKAGDVLPAPIETRFVRTTIFSAASEGHPVGEWVGMQEQTIETE